MNESPKLKAIHICNSHQPTLQPKIAKEYVFANADGRKNKKYDRTTMGIKHRADSGFRKFQVLSKLCLGGQVSSSEMPYVSYPRPLAIIKNETSPNSIYFSGFDFLL